MSRVSMRRPYRSIKNKNLKKDLLLMSLFSFQYAGKADVFISMKHKKYCVIASGIHIFDDIYVFAPHFKHEFITDSLYNAILIFNQIIQFITSSMDWYKPEIFDSQDVYKEITIE